jgi:hypothetical protein
MLSIRLYGNAAATDVGGGLPPDGQAAVYAKLGLIDDLKTTHVSSIPPA